MPEAMTAPPAEGRVSIGNPGLDAMLDGGLVPHRPYLIVGPAGTGKTTLALQFLCEGVRRGERSLLVTLEEPPNEARINHRSLQPELDRVHVFDAIPDVMRYEHTPFKDIATVRQIVPFGQIGYNIRKTPELTSVEVTIAALEQMLRSEVTRRGYSRVVIDSLTALQYFCMKGFDPVGGAQTFMRFVSDLRTTTILTVESPLEDVDTPERMLARGEIRLFRWELDGVTVRAVGVEKFRGSSHDVRLHPYRIGIQGLDVNLAVTISRDTRQILEPRPVVVEAARHPPLPPPLLEPLSEEVEDLIALGADVGPLRGEVEAALGAVRSGRSEEAVLHISRASSLTIALAESVVQSRRGVAPGEGSVANALRRVAHRAEAVRVGLPPTRLPDPDSLVDQLDKMLVMLTGPSAAPRRGAPPEPASLVRAAPPVQEPSPPPAARPAPTPMGPIVPPTAPVRPPEPVPAGAGDAGRELKTSPAQPPPLARPGPVPPSAPRRRRRAPATAAPSAPASVPSARPTPPPVRPAPIPRAIPEPPPLPDSLTRGPSRGGAASTGTRPGSPTSARPTRPVPPAGAGGSETPPPLPHIAPPEIEPVAVPTPSVVEGKAPVPAVKRRRKAASSRSKSGAATPAPPTASPPPTPLGETPPSLVKPRRRAVRRRKAPPVVAATAEPLEPRGAPTDEPPTSSEGPKEGG